MPWEIPVWGSWGSWGRLLTSPPHAPRPRLSHIGEREATQSPQEALAKRGSEVRLSGAGTRGCLNRVIHPLKTTYPCPLG